MQPSTLSWNSMHVLYWVVEWPVIAVLWGCRLNPNFSSAWIGSLHGARSWSAMNMIVFHSWTFICTRRKRSLNSNAAVEMLIHACITLRLLSRLGKSKSMKRILEESMDQIKHTDAIDTDIFVQIYNTCLDAMLPSRRDGWLCDGGWHLWHLR